MKKKSYYVLIPHLSLKHFNSSTECAVNNFLIFLCYCAICFCHRMLWILIFPCKYVLFSCKSHRHLWVALESGVNSSPLVLSIAAGRFFGMALALWPLTRTFLFSDADFQESHCVFTLGVHLHQTVRGGFETNSKNVILLLFHEVAFATKLTLKFRCQGHACNVNVQSCEEECKKIKKLGKVFSALLVWMESSAGKQRALVYIDDLQL